MAIMNRLNADSSAINPLRLMLLFMFALPTFLYGQYKGSDNCLVSFRNYPNSGGKLEHAVEGVSFSFQPGVYAWDVTIKNGTDDEMVVDWKNAQFLINGMTSGVVCRFAGMGNAAEAQTMTLIGAGMSFNGSLSPSMLNSDKTRKIYDSKMLSKNNKRLVVIVIPTSFRGGPRHYNSFDFLIENDKN